MPLFEKIMGTDVSEIKVPIHGITTALRLWAEGEITRANVVAFLELDDTAGNDKEDLDYLVSKYTSATDKERFFLYLFELLALGEIEASLRNDPNYTGTLLGYDQKATFTATLDSVAV